MVAQSQSYIMMMLTTSTVCSVEPRSFYSLTTKSTKKQVPIDFPSGGYSGVDVDRVDFVKYPSLENVEYFNVTMEPGDCLFIPYKWYHQVRSYDRNIAVNVWWKHLPDFVPQDCDMEPNQTLDNFRFSSLEEDANNSQEQEGFMGHISALVANGQVGFREFEDKLKTEPAIVGDEPFVWNDKLSAVAKKIFQALDNDKDGFFSKHDVKLLENNSVESFVENELARIEDMIEDQMEDQMESNYSPHDEEKDEL